LRNISENTSYAFQALSSDPNLKNSVPKDLFEHLLNKLPKLEIDGETFYVAEGDTLLDEDQLFLYAGQREALDKARQAADLAMKGGMGLIGVASSIRSETNPVGLLAMVQGGRIVRWNPGTILTYCVLRNTFPSESQYRLVVDNMIRATEDWERTCGVRFDYIASADDDSGIRPDGVLFPVRYIDARGRFIASAFFPNDPVNRRRVFIDPSYFTTTFNKVGVLRHELGHVLGFRHEHIRSGAPPDCPDEDTTGIFDVTKYDPHSVMHYFCGGVGSQELTISDLDREGSQKVYGPPLSDFMLISPT
jgi:hypothetical protein